MAHTNVSDDDATIMYLSKQGYGSLREIQSLDTPEILDLVEYESIQRDIEAHYLEKSRAK